MKTINCYFCKKIILASNYTDVVRCKCNNYTYYYIGNSGNLYEICYCEKIYFGLEILIYRDDLHLNKSLFESGCTAVAKIPNNKISEIIDKNLKFDSADELIKYLIAKHEKYSENLIFL